MDNGAGGRLSLVVLAVGASWWVAAAPPSTVESTAQAIEPEPPVEEPVGDPDNMLPTFDNTVTRHIEQLRPDEGWGLPIDTQRDGKYLLQYVCLGPGTLSIRIEGTDQGEQLHEVDCGGSFSTIEFTAGTLKVTVSVRRPGQSEPAEVGIQVIALP